MHFKKNGDNIEIALRGVVEGEMKRGILLFILVFIIAGLMMILVVMKAVQPPEGLYHANFIYYYEMKKKEASEDIKKSSEIFNKIQSFSLFDTINKFWEEVKK